MSKYVDGFVIVMPKDKIEEYKKIAEDAGKIWKKYGALDYKECMGDDMHPEGIELTFPALMNMKSDEVVFFSYILYPSRQDRDEINKKVMADPEIMNTSPEKMPFEMKKMAMGGFEVLVDLF